MKSGQKSRAGRVAAIIEARMTSSRLPGKVLMDICGKPALEHLVGDPDFPIHRHRSEVV